MGRLTERSAVGAAIAIAWVAFQIWVAAGGELPAMVQRPVHVMFALILSFVTRPLDGKRWRGGRDTALSAIASGLAVATCVYQLVEYERIAGRMEFVDPVSGLDTVFAVVLVVLVLEATRRVGDWGLFAVTAVALAYAFLGPWMPAGLAHRGLTLRQLVELEFLSTAGIFGLPIGVSMEYVFYFVLFGAFLERSGGGQLFMDLALRLSGRGADAPARTAIIGSGLLGTISGSAVANVTTTGVVTIPQMIRAGYRPVVAAAVEAVASTGGQIMPPIMGAAAFVMAQLIGVPYARVAGAAVPPALLFYLAIFIMMKLYVLRDGLAPHRHAVAAAGAWWRRCHLLIPLAVLVYYIVAQYSLMTAAFRALVVLLVVSLLFRDSWLTPRGVLEAAAEGGKTAVVVAIPCAAAGIIVSVVVMTGIGFRISDLMLAASARTLVGALGVAMVGCLILGMGMPTTSAYIVAATLFGPPLAALGVPALAAHLFLFYFAIISMVTPPVALAAYAAAAIARTSMAAAGWQAFGFSLSGFLIPYAFVVQPALIGEGPLSALVPSLATAVLGIFALSAAVVGYVFRNLRAWERVVMAAAGVSLIVPEPISDIGGLLVLGAMLAWTRRTRQRSRTGSPRPLTGAAEAGDAEAARTGMTTRPHRKLGRDADG